MGTSNGRRLGGFSLVETMIVSSIFVLIAMSIYGTLTNLTKMHGAADSAIELQLEGQKALNTIVNDLRNAGFYRANPDLTLAPYDSNLWVTQPEVDPHLTWDVPYLFKGDAVAEGTFAPLSHAPALHKAAPSDEEFNATREMCFVPLAKVVAGDPTIPPSVGVLWSNAAFLGATSSIVLVPTFQVVSYELHPGTAGTAKINRLKKITRSADPAAGTIGALVNEVDLARYVEAVRFDTAQTDASLALYTVRVTIWLRKVASGGNELRAKVTSRVKLRNSVKP